MGSSLDLLLVHELFTKLENGAFQHVMRSLSIYWRVVYDIFVWIDKRRRFETLVCEFNRARVNLSEGIIVAQLS